MASGSLIKISGGKLYDMHETCVVCAYVHVHVDSQTRKTIADTGESCISDDNSIFIQKHISGVQTLMDNAPGMQITHSSSNLLSNVNGFIHWEGI